MTLLEWLIKIFGGGGNHPNPPIPPIPPVMEIHITCFDEQGNIKLPTGGSLLLDNNVTSVGVVAPPTQIHFTGQYGIGATLTLNGLDDYKLETHDPAASNRIVTAPDVNVSLIKQIKLAPLVVDGVFFKNLVIKEFSSFKLYQKFLDGEDIGPVVVEILSIGGNCVRVFGMYDNIGKFNPDNYPAYYTRLPEFADKLASYGVYLEFTALPDCHIIWNNQSKETTHWNKVRDALAGKINVLLEPQNEVDQQPNITDLNVLVHRGDTISCMGSFGGNFAIAPRPWKRYEVVHLNGQPEWWRKPHNALETSQGLNGVPASWVPCLFNETGRFQTDTNLHHWEDYALTAAMMSAGACFHYTSGVNSVLMTPEEKGGAEAFITGFNRADLSQRTGAYSHLEGQEGPNDLRVYRMGNFVWSVRKV